jgi:hypothetical protein
MRRIETHKVNAANEILEIEVLDQPGVGGANHLYEIFGFNTETNTSSDFDTPKASTKLLFQNGCIPDNGTNGITQEALLAIVADRLDAFQDGPFACNENKRALEAVNEAIHWLHFRTLKRTARNVEGTHQV